MADDRSELERVFPASDPVVIRPGYPRVPAYPEPVDYGYGYGAEQEGFHLRDLWRVVRKRLWLIITIAIIITSIVTIDAYRTKSTYQASAIIELGKENTTMVKSGDVIIETDDDMYYPLLSIKTKMLRLTSEPLLEDVIVNLKLDENPKFLDVGQKKSFWEAVASIRDRFKSQADEAASEAATVVAVASPKGPAERSPEESERLSPYVGVLAGNLQVEPIKDTRAIRLTFTHTDPQIAAAVTNGIADHFIERNFQTKTEKFTSASEWLDRTTREMKAKVQQAEQELATYSRDHNIFSTEGKETLTTDKMSRLHDQATRAETERILKQSIYEEVRQGRVSQLPAAFADQKLNALQAKLEELVAAEARLDLKYGPDNPQLVDTRRQIQTAREQIEATRRALEDRLRSEFELASRDEISLKTALAQAKQEAVRQNQDAIQYNILKQEVDTAKSLYTDFLHKMSQARAEVAQQHNNLHMIQPAKVPRGPIGPGRFRIILFGFLVSLAGGVGLAFFLEYLDSTIKTVEDVGRFIRLPALGVIPAISTRGPRQVSPKKRHAELVQGEREDDAPALVTDKLAVLDNRSTAAEAYRVLRTSMLLSAAGSPPRTILITSGQPGEGKTTTVVNTAVSLAQLGASVLIIDCDLRKPAAHKTFGVENSTGLSTYLSRDVELNELIHRLQIPNLSLLPCGAIPPNPAELLASEKMKNMLAALREQYDHILIDSPPLLSVTDPVILSTLVDGVMLVVHGGKSTRAVARRARQELQTVGAKIFGVVLNNLDLRGNGYGYEYYQYYSVPEQRDADAPGF
ncbi:MAG TPA: polysaccharide biosynthesis tyrosine autokinase [Blastocatellia bacterium]|nr:polysaccharide biosynthesis tyrosine autokinase [Blastocatellia bacterium]